MNKAATAVMTNIKNREKTTKVPKHHRPEDASGYDKAKKITGEIFKAEEARVFACEDRFGENIHLTIHAEAKFQICQGDIAAYFETHAKELAELICGTMLLK